MYAKNLLISLLGLTLFAAVAIEARLLVKRQALVDRLGNAASGAISGFSNDGRLPNTKPSSASLTLPNSQANPKLPATTTNNNANSNTNVNDEPNTSPLDDINSPEPTNIEEKQPSARPQARPPQQADLNPQQPDLDDDRPKRKQPSRRPTGVSSATSFISSKKPGKKQHNDYDSTGDDDNDDDYAHSDSSSAYDYRDGDYGSSMMEPMRHMKGMFARIFDSFPTMDSMYQDGGDYSDDNNGNIAMASSYSSGDGYARSRSTVSNNGRMRGILSETRNGRTRTRRIGSADSDDDEY